MHLPMDNAVVEAPATIRIDRRAALKAALGGAAAAAVLTGPRIESFSVAPSYAAAASGSVTMGLYKAVSGNNPFPTNFCSVGAATSITRGSVTFTRSGGPETISVAVTISIGQDATGRTVTIYQSNGTSCVATSVVGTWPGGNGPHQFSAPIVAGATIFTMSMTASGGGGNDDTGTGLVSLP